jgi:hypothetical protein
MADEIDRKYLPELVQTSFEVYLGACYKSFEMMKNPQDAAANMFGEMKEMFILAKDAGEGLRQKAEAAAGIWVCKGIDLMQSCKTAGEKFTEAK